MSNEGTVALNNYLQAKDMLASLVWTETPTGTAHAPLWTVTCRINGVEMGIGTGAQKHAAKDEAAREALKALEALHTTEEGETE